MTTQESKKIQHRFHRTMKYLVRALSIIMIFLVGHWRYSTGYPPLKWSDFVGGMMIAAPFSPGLWLSTTRFGRWHKVITLILLVPSALIHLSFANYLHWGFVIAVLILEYYGIHSLFIKENKN